MTFLTKPLFYSQSLRTWSAVRTQASSSFISCRLKFDWVEILKTWKSPELRFWWPLAVCRVFHKIKQQCWECGALCQLPGGSGWDLPALGRDGQWAVAVPKHAQCQLNCSQLQHQALLLPHQHLFVLSHREARAKHDPLLSPRLWTSSHDCQLRCFM